MNRWVDPDNPIDLVLRTWWMARATSQQPAEPARAAEREFETWVDRYRGALERLCAFREHNPTKRQDLWQDMLLALWKARGSHRGEGTEKAWVMRIAHNVAASHVARSIRDHRSEPEVEEVARDCPADRRAEATELWDRLQRLDLGSQQLVLLYLEGLTSSEIAEVTGMSQSNVTTRLSRIRAQLTEGREG